VILILTKRQAHCGRTKTAKSGAKHVKTALTTFKKRTLIRDNTVVQLVAEGVARATQVATAEPNRIRTSRLKMENPKTFDGKPTTPFNNWWKTVTKYLSFYPETYDQQKIVWVGTLLTGTAKA